MKKYKILAVFVLFIFVVVHIVACNQSSLSDDVVGYRLIRTPIPKVTLKDTGTKVNPKGISYTELGYKAVRLMLKLLCFFKILTDAKYRNGHYFWC